MFISKQKLVFNGRNGLLKVEYILYYGNKYLVVTSNQKCIHHFDNAQKQIKIASDSKRAPKITKFILNFIHVVKFFGVFWHFRQIDSIFEWEMYSGSKHMTYCIWFSLLWHIMSLLLMFMWYRYHMYFRF